jgi:hypothetical protein
MTFIDIKINDYGRAMVDETKFGLLDILASFQTDANISYPVFHQGAVFVGCSSDRISVCGTGHERDAVGIIACSVH